MNKLYFVIFLLSTSFLSSEEIDLNKAIEYALNNNFSIRLVKLQTEIAELNSGMENSGMLPTVSANAGLGENIQHSELVFSQIPPQSNRDAASSSLNGSVSLNWTLFDGLAMFSNYEKLEALKEQSQIELQIQMENTIKSVIESYLNCLTLKDLIKNQNDMIGISKTRLEKAQSLENIGSGSSIQTLQAQVDLNNDLKTLKETELNYDISINQLKYLIGITSDKQLQIKSAYSIKEYENFSSLKTKVYDNNSSLIKAIKEKDISDYDYRIAYSNLLPRVNLNASYSYAKNENEAGFMLLNEAWGPQIGLNASWNVFNGGRNINQISVSKINIKSKELAIQSLKTSLEFNLQNAFKTYQTRKEILKMAESNILAAEQNFNKTSENYNFGNISSIELRQAQLNLTMAKNELIQSQSNLKKAEVELLILTGEILN